jgi:hypothetical protein
LGFFLQHDQVNSSVDIFDAQKGANFKKLLYMRKRPLIKKNMRCGNTLNFSSIQPNHQ